MKPKTLARFAAAALALQLPAVLPADTAPVDARVTLPYPELKRLLDEAEQARAEQTRIPRPPIASTLLSARYRLLFDPRTPRLEAEFEVLHLEPGWQRIPLTRLRLPAVTQVPEAAPLVTSPDGTLCFLSDKPGRHTLRVQFDLPPAGQQGPWFTLATVGSPSASLEIGPLPEGVALRAEGIAEPLTGRIPLPPQPIDLGLRVVHPQPETPTEWSVLSQTFAEEIETGIAVTSRISPTAVSGSGGPLRLTLPDAAVDIRVEGGTSEVLPGSRPPRVAVRWSDRPGPTFIHYRIPASPLATEWSVAPPDPADTRTHEALVAIACPASARLDAPGTSRNPAGLPAWLGEQIRGREFALGRKTAPLQVRIRRQSLAETADAVIRSAKFQTRIAAGGALHGEALLEVESSVPTRIGIRLPEGAELLTCNLQGQNLRPAIGEQGVLEIPVPAKADGTSALRLTHTARIPRPDPAGGRLDLALPSTDTFIHQSEWTVALPAAWEIRGIEEAFEQIETPPPSATETRAILRSRFVRKEAPTGQIHYRPRIESR